MDLTAEQIARVLTNYKNKRERENKYYHEVTKNKEEFKIKNRESAKAHYENGYKEKKEKTIRIIKIFKNKSLYNYYKRNDKIEVLRRNMRRNIRC
jgi:hypothetical protein